MTVIGILASSLFVIEQYFPIKNSSPVKRKTFNRYVLNPDHLILEQNCLCLASRVTTESDQVANRLWWSIRQWGQLFSFGIAKVPATYQQKWRRLRRVMWVLWQHVPCGQRDWASSVGLPELLRNSYLRKVNWLENRRYPILSYRPAIRERIIQIFFYISLPRD